MFVEKPGKLASQIKKEESSIKKLTISGNQLNAKDYEALKKCVNLESLDISELKDYHGIYGIGFDGFPVLSTLKEICIRYRDRTKDLKRGDAGEARNAPDEYKSDFTALNEITSMSRHLLDDAIIKIAPNADKIVIKNVFLPYSLNFDAPELLKVWTPEEIRRGNKISVSLNDGTFIYEKIKDESEILPRNYHLLNGNVNVDNTEFLKFDNAIYIGQQAFYTVLKDTPIRTLTIPKSIHFLDFHAVSFDCRNANPISIETEESDEPLFICNGGLFCASIDQIVFNRPVYLCDEAFRQSKIGKVFFNKDVEYLGKYSFYGGVEEMHFKKSPKKMDEICRSTGSEMIKRAYIPASEQAKFKAAGASSYFLSIISTK